MHKPYEGRMGFFLLTNYEPIYSIDQSFFQVVGSIDAYPMKYAARVRAQGHRKVRDWFVPRSRLKIIGALFLEIVAPNVGCWAFFVFAK